MPTLKQEYLQFLDQNFNGFLPLVNLYACCEYALRFDLQHEKYNQPYTNEYFEEVLERSSTLFEKSFEKNDNLYLVFIDCKHKGGKIRFKNFVFRQIKDLAKSEINFSYIDGWYYGGKYDRAIIKLNVERVDYREILKAIGNQDFSRRQPSLGRSGMYSNKKVFFINIDKKLIFHMYDDRGLDIVATDKEILRPIYETYNDWILDYNREEIDRLFVSNSSLIQ